MDFLLTLFSFPNCLHLLFAVKATIHLVSLTMLTPVTVYEQLVLTYLIYFIIINLNSQVVGPIIVMAIGPLLIACHDVEMLCIIGLQHYSTINRLFHSFTGVILYLMDIQNTMWLFFIIIIIIFVILYVRYINTCICLSQKHFFFCMIIATRQQKFYIHNFKFISY